MLCFNIAKTDKANTQEDGATERNNHGRAFDKAKVAEDSCPRAALSPQQMGQGKLSTFMRVADIMTAPTNYQLFLAVRTGKQTIVDFDLLEIAVALANWTRNRVIVKSVSVHQRQPSSLSRSAPEMIQFFRSKSLGITQH